MFSIVTNTEEYRFNKITNISNDKFRFADYNKYIDEIAKIMIDTRHAYLNGFNINRNNVIDKESSTNTFKRRSGFFTIKSTYKDLLRSAFEKDEDLKYIWSILSYTEYDCDPYPFLFCTSPQKILENEIDVKQLKNKLNTRYFEKLYWLNYFFQAQDKIYENKNEKTIFILCNDDKNLKMIKINENYNNIYIWDDKKETKYSIRAPHNIEYIKRIENEIFYIYKIKIFRIDNLFTIVWPKNIDMSFDEIIYSN